MSNNTFSINHNLVLNPFLNSTYKNTKNSSITNDIVKAAEQRLRKYAPLLMHLFPELVQMEGIIESNLTSIKPLVDYSDSWGRFWVKEDHNLPVAGSIKARGGIHEVLEFLDSLVDKYSLMPTGNVIELLSAKSRNVLSRHKVVVGSTGNLGLSIGIMASSLGFQAIVHMSSEAKSWKKELLRNKGVSVYEHKGDYAKAVAVGREEALLDEYSHFVDDEKSVSLFAGYAVAATRLRRQLEERSIQVAKEFPLFVYLPCGVGGAPGGICYGLKNIFGENVHCFFIEPEQSSCFTVQMTHLGEPNKSIYDVGQTNNTEADGLAVPVASQLAVEEMIGRLSGMITLRDDNLFLDLYRIKQQENMKIEPSAAAVFSGPRAIFNSEQGRYYIEKHGMAPHLKNANHILWTTGGSFLPQKEYELFWLKGKKISESITRNLG